MALNKYMHPRNIYKTRKPDFKALSSKYDYFNEKVKVNASGKVILDFKDPAALRALFRALLEDDFGLAVTVPLDRLIPTVPQRVNYILWLEDIIGKENGAKGIDIGTGSSCIYPLLGCRLNQWQFLASEIDDQNMYFANKNVASNKMEDKITIKKVTEDTLLIGLVDENEIYDFSMCNPPFYSDHLEAQGITSARNDDRSESSSISTASEAESIAWGGEVRFVTQMIEESLILKNKIRVYTSLLGKKMSLSLLKDVLQRKKVPKYASTEFCQGKTMRWGIAWTFDETVEFPKSSFKEQKNIKPPLHLEIPRSSAEVVGDYTVPTHSWFLIKQLEELKIHFYTKHNGKFYACFIIQAKENTWSHQRRKRRQQHKHETELKAGDQKKSVESDLKDVEKRSSKLENAGKEIEAESASKGIDSECNPAEKIEDIESEVTDKSLEVEKKVRKRTLSDQDSGLDSKKVKLDSDDQCKEVEGKGKNTEENGNGNLGEKNDLTDETVKQEVESSNKLVRKDVIEQFWKEKQANSEKKPGKKVEKSFYESLEPFNEEEECLLLSKIVLRKEEGIISLSMTYMSGKRESMHQILQFFKNKLCAKQKS
ncbi:RNA N6-adenosine-methyltransferase mettl16-like [Mercenaria mercenaria]|uniref:RNA N6-adenosine-methyltransferase mettl16-like n=1 Tax=Mercenaria mercenaria TaxID=6596 RepID=UPI00234F4C52|nr:RNA N6-adenosine-methyltransferase mettl16-like [Mercenaria mercenaria]XP_053376166.1 RNA N6-adenosine-methyltransferase mettl16-like [Mercenaria mercenaria]